MAHTGPALAAIREIQDVKARSICDCVLSHNGVGMSGRECDCQAEGFTAHTGLSLAAFEEIKSLTASRDQWKQCAIDLDKTVVDIEAQLTIVQNAAKTLAQAQNTELQHRRDNSDYDHKLRSEHESLMERDALMTAENETLTARVQMLRAALVSATANLSGAASAYRSHASRHKSIQPKSRPDPFYSTRVLDFERAEGDARAALEGAK